MCFACEEKCPECVYETKYDKDPRSFTGTTSRYVVKTVCRECVDAYDVQQEPGYAYGGMTEQVRTFYSKTLLDRLVPALEHASHGLNEDIPPHTGKQIVKRRFESYDQ